MSSDGEFMDWSEHLSPEFLERIDQSNIEEPVLASMLYGLPVVGANFNSAGSGEKRLGCITPLEVAGIDNHILHDSMFNALLDKSGLDLSILDQDPNNRDDAARFYYLVFYKDTSKIERSLLANLVADRLRDPAVRALGSKQADVKILRGAITPTKQNKAKGTYIERKDVESVLEASWAIDKLLNPHIPQIVDQPLRAPEDEDFFEIERPVRSKEAVAADKDRRAKVSTELRLRNVKVALRRNATEPKTNTPNIAKPVTVPPLKPVVSEPETRFVVQDNRSRTDPSSPFKVTVHQDHLSVVRSMEISTLPVSETSDVSVERDTPTTIPSHWQRNLGLGITSAAVGAGAILSGGTAFGAEQPRIIDTSTHGSLLFDTPANKAPETAAASVEIQKHANHYPWISDSLNNEIVAKAAAHDDANSLRTVFYIENVLHRDPIHHVANMALSAQTWEAYKVAAEPGTTPHSSDISDLIATAAKVFDQLHDQKNQPVGSLKEYARPGTQLYAVLSYYIGAGNMQHFSETRLPFGGLSTAHQQLANEAVQLLDVFNSKNPVLAENWQPTPLGGSVENKPAHSNKNIEATHAKPEAVAPRKAPEHFPVVSNEDSLAAVSNPQLKDLIIHAAGIYNESSSAKAFSEQTLAILWQSYKGEHALSEAPLSSENIFNFDQQVWEVYLETHPGASRDNPADALDAAAWLIHEQQDSMPQLSHVAELDAAMTFRFGAGMLAGRTLAELTHKELGYLHEYTKELFVLQTTVATKPLLRPAPKVVLTVPVAPAVHDPVVVVSLPPQVIHPAVVPEVFPASEMSQSELLAKDIFANSNITIDHLAPDDRVALSLLDDEKYGKTFIDNITHRMSVTLSPQLLQDVLILANYGNKVEITSITTGEHVENSQHYLGMAIDIAPPDGSPQGYKSLVQYVFDNRTAMGVDQMIFGGALPMGTQLLNKGAPVSSDFYQSELAEHLTHVHLSVMNSNPLPMNTTVGQLPTPVLPPVSAPSALPTPIQPAPLNPSASISPSPSTLPTPGETTASGSSQSPEPSTVPDPSVSPSASPDAPSPSPDATPSMSAPAEPSVAPSASSSPSPSPDPSEQPAETEPTMPLESYSTDTSALSISGVTAAQLNALLINTGLAGTGDAFMSGENNQGINALYEVAHAMIESADGDSRIAKEHNNLFGINAVDVDPEKAYNYASYSACIEYWEGWLRAQYLSPDGSHYGGGTTISDIFVHYSTAGQKEAHSVVNVIDNQLIPDIESGQPLVDSRRPVPTPSTPAPQPSQVSAPPVQSVTPSPIPTQSPSPDASPSDSDSSSPSPSDTAPSDSPSPNESSDSPVASIPAQPSDAAPSSLPPVSSVVATTSSDSSSPSGSATYTPRHNRHHDDNSGSDGTNAASASAAVSGAPAPMPEPTPGN